MDHRRWEQLGGAAGIIAVAMILVAMFLPGTLASDSTSGETRQFLIDNKDQILVQSVMVGGGILLLLLFLATLRNVLRRTETETGVSCPP